VIDDLLWCVSVLVLQVSVSEICLGLLDALIAASYQLSVITSKASSEVQGGLGIQSAWKCFQRIFGLALQSSVPQDHTPQGFEEAIGFS
jgi:hypothetical protein